MAQTVLVIFSLIFFMDGSRTDRMMWVILGKFAWGNGEGRIPNEIFLYYFSKEPLMQLTQSVTLRAWKKFEGF